MLLKLSYLNSNFTLILGYLNPALNNNKLKQTTTCHLIIMPSQPTQINTFVNVDAVLSDNNNKNLHVVVHLYEPCSTSLYKNFPIG